MFLKKP